MTLAIFENSQVTAGIVKETSYGAGGAPAFFIPTDSLGPDDVNAVVGDQAWRGAPGDAWGYAPGPTSGVVPFGGNAYPDAVGFPLAGVLGDVASAGTGPTVWTMAALNSGTQQPASYAVTTTDGVNSRLFPGLKFTSVELSATAEGQLQYKASSVSQISAPATGPSLSWTAAKAVPAWVGAHQLGGAAIAPLACSVKLERTVEAKRNNDGSPAPYLQRSGLLKVSGSVTLILQTDTYRLLYVAGTASSIDLTWAQGAGATATQTRVHCSSIIFDSVSSDYSSGLYSIVKIAWSASYNTTDVGASGGTSPCLVTLKNALAAGTY